MLTNSELNQIKNFLALYGKKDSQLSPVTTVDNTDYVAIVQNATNKNVRITIELLKKAVLEGLVNDDVFDLLIDAEPTKDSRKLVRSNGIWHAINDNDVIDTHQIKDNAITTNKIASDNITREKLSDTLRKQIEKYTSSISVNPDKLRITGNTLTTTLTKTDKIVSFGDAGESTTTPDSSRITIPPNAGTIDGNTWTLPNTVGTYTVTYEAKKNGTIRTTTANVYVYLRKYFGFSTTAPSSFADLENLSEKADSPTVAWDGYINAKGTGDKYIYFAVPANMTISHISQPDALYAPFPFTQLSNITVTISGQNYTYKLYRSEDMVDSGADKRLAIS